MKTSKQTEKEIESIDTLGLLLKCRVESLVQHGTKTWEWKRLIRITHLPTGTIVEEKIGPSNNKSMKEAIKRLKEKLKVK